MSQWTKFSGENIRSQDKESDDTHQQTQENSIVAIVAIDSIEKL